MIWVACFNGACARRFNPQTGELVAEVRVPKKVGTQVTSVAFGGEGLGDLYLTTAHEHVPVSDLEAQGIPLAGALLVVPRSKLESIKASHGSPTNMLRLGATSGSGAPATC